MKNKMNKCPQPDAKTLKRQKEADKKSIDACKMLFKARMKGASAEQWTSLLKLINKVQNSADAYKRICAEYGRYWGCLSYLAKYDMCGRKYELIGKRTKAYRSVSAAVKARKAEVGEHDAHLGLDGVVSADGGDHYIAFISGGNNGRSDWQAYLESLKRIMASQKRAWLLEMNTHSDIYYALIGFEV